MSILADLLSKKNVDEATTGKDIPPTLARAHGPSAKKQAPQKLYVIIAIFAVIFIGAGLAIMLKMGHLTPPALAPTPEPVKYPLPSPLATAVAPLQATVAPPPPQPPVQQAAIAAAPLQTAEVKHKGKATFATKSVPKKHKLGAVVPATVQRHAASGLSAKASVKKQDFSARPSTEVRPDTAAKDALLYAARSAEQAGDWRLAHATYRRALEIDPDNYKILSNSAAALNNLGMFDEGAQEAKRALDKKSNYIPAMINYAIACSSKGNNQEALRYFSAAHTADPSNRNLAINLGILQERLGKLDEAKATYRKLAEAGDPLALMGIGRISERKGNRTEALHAYRQLMAMRDLDPAVRKEVKAKLARLEE